MSLRESAQKRGEKERVRHALLRAALQLASQHGFASLGLREVSRAAEIAPTSFYRHFTDMSELGSALIEELVRPLVRSLVVRVLGAELRAQPAVLVAGVFSALAEDGELVRFVLAERVGAFAALRKALALELEVLASALHTAPQGTVRGEPPRRAVFAGEAAVALLLDGLLRALDASTEELEDVRVRLVGALTVVLEEPRSEVKQR